jgi:hypothetical protein
LVTTQLRRPLDPKKLDPESPDPKGHNVHGQAHEMVGVGR